MPWEHQGRVVNANYGGLIRCALWDEDYVDAAVLLIRAGFAAGGGRRFGRERISARSHARLPW
jgi:hypothetical protein